MAPSATETETLSNVLKSLTLRATETSTSANNDTQAKSNSQEEPYRYAHLLPIFTNDRYPPLEPYEHVDPASRALTHSNPRSFLDSATFVHDLTPVIGTEVHGVNLATLSNKERDQLALLTARRGLVVFRDQQDFIDRGGEFYREWGRYFGRLHIHPTSGHPAGLPEIHLVYKDAQTSFNFEINDSVTTTVWHSDVSYEVQPPGLTTFFLLAQPTTGGDTLFLAQGAALRRLSPALQAFLRTLSVVHSGVEQADFSRKGRRGGVVRREPVETVHPLVRRHPVTGEEALYVNRQFTRRIVELKKEESETLLSFLYDHMAKAGDLQARVQWTPNTVVLWDNRVTAHSAIVDYGESGERRHGARITPQAERPIPAFEGLKLD